MPERVKLLDVNVLVALALDSHVHHRAAHQALRSMTRGWATCPTTEAGLLRLLLNPAVTGAAFTATEIREVLAGMQAHPAWRFLAEDRSMLASDLDWSVVVGHKQVTDFHLVEVAARHGAALATFDAALASSLGAADRRHVEVLAI